MENENQQNGLIGVNTSNFDHMFNTNEENVASSGRLDVEKSDLPPKKTEKLNNTKENEEDVSVTQNVKDIKSDDGKSLEEEGEAEEKPKEEKKKYTDWKTQAEKESKRLKETQKWANEIKTQLNSYKRSVEKFVNDGLLHEDDAKFLLDHTQYKEISDSVLSETEKASKIFREEIENIRKYGNYENLDGHVKALDHLVENSTQEEIEDMFSDVKELMDDDSVLFTKKILEIASNYYEDVYEDLYKAGNLKNMKLEYQNEISKRDKTIDKLEKELVKLKKRYEDYDTNPQHRIPQTGGDKIGGSVSRNSANVMNDPGGFLEEERRGNRRY